MTSLNALLPRLLVCFFYPFVKRIVPKCGDCRIGCLLQKVYHLVTGDPDCCSSDSPWWTFEARHFWGYQVCYQGMQRHLILFDCLFMCCHSSPVQVPSKQTWIRIFCVLYYCILLFYTFCIGHLFRDVPTLWTTFNWCQQDFAKPWCYGTKSRVWQLRALMILHHKIWSVNWL